MSPLKVLIVEDEVLIAEHIKDLLFSFGMEQIHFADTKSSAIQMIKDVKPDLAILDLHLEAAMDGLSVAKYIDETISIPYIFVTANSDKLVMQKAIDTKASAYITKPLKKSDFFATVQIALKSNKSEEIKCLQVKTGGSVVRIPYHEIKYIESNGNYIHIHTNKGKTLLRQSLEWAEEHLPKHLFLRVQRSFLINVNYVTKLNAKSLFIDEIEIPISRTITSEVMSFFKSL